jgi:hypothetical protein
MIKSEKVRVKLSMGICLPLRYRKLNEKIKIK